MCYQLEPTGVSTNPYMVPCLLHPPLIFNDELLQQTPYNNSGSRSNFVGSNNTAKIPWGGEFGGSQLLHNVHSTLRSIMSRAREKTTYLELLILTVFYCTTVMFLIATH